MNKYERITTREESYIPGDAQELIYRISLGVDDDTLNRLGELLRPAICDLISSQLTRSISSKCLRQTISNHIRAGELPDYFLNNHVLSACSDNHTSRSFLKEYILTHPTKLDQEKESFVDFLANELPSQLYEIFEPQATSLAIDCQNDPTNSELRKTLADWIYPLLLYKAELYAPKSEDPQLCLDALEYFISTRILKSHETDNRYVLVLRYDKTKYSSFTKYILGGQPKGRLVGDISRYIVNYPKDHGTSIVEESDYSDAYDDFEKKRGYDFEQLVYDAVDLYKEYFDNINLFDMDHIMDLPPIDPNGNAKDYIVSRRVDELKLITHHVFFLHFEFNRDLPKNDSNPEKRKQKAKACVKELFTKLEDSIAFADLNTLVNSLYHKHFVQALDQLHLDFKYKTYFMEKLESRITKRGMNEILFPISQIKPDTYNGWIDTVQNKEKGRHYHTLQAELQKLRKSYIDGDYMKNE